VDNGAELSKSREENLVSNPSLDDIQARANRYCKIDIIGASGVHVADELNGAGGFHVVKELGGAGSVQVLEELNGAGGVYVVEGLSSDIREVTEACEAFLQSAHGNAEGNDSVTQDGDSVGKASSDNVGLCLAACERVVGKNIDDVSMEENVQSERKI